MKERLISLALLLAIVVICMPFQLVSAQDINTYITKADYISGTDNLGNAIPPQYYYWYLEGGTTGNSYSAVAQLYTRDHAPVYDMDLNAKVIFYDGAGKVILSRDLSNSETSWYIRGLNTGTMPADTVSYEVIITDGNIYGPADTMRWMIHVSNISTGKIICAK